MSAGMVSREQSRMSLRESCRTCKSRLILRGTDLCFGTPMGRERAGQGLERCDLVASAVRRQVRKSEGCKLRQVLGSAVGRLGAKVIGPRARVISHAVPQAAHSGAPDKTYKPLPFRYYVQ